MTFSIKPLAQSALAISAVLLSLMQTPAALAQPTANPVPPIPTPAPVVQPSSTQPGFIPGPTTTEIRIPRSRPATTQFILNFKDAPVDAVLQHLSEVAGFTIIKEGTGLTGRVTVIGATEIDSAQAITLLNSILKANDYAAVVQGKILKVMPLSAAKKAAGILVEMGSDPATVPVDDTLRVQIIPIKTIDALKLKTNLAPFISPNADITADAASNTIVIIIFLNIFSPFVYLLSVLSLLNIFFSFKNIFLIHFFYTLFS